MTDAEDAERDVSHDFAPEADMPQTAIDLALKSRRSGGATGAAATAYLLKQTQLLDVQLEHLHEQRELNLNHLRWRRFGDRMKGMIQALGVLGGGAVVCGVLAMSWSAYRDRSLVIEPFSVPPTMAQRGLTGAVVASHLLARLSQLQAKTDSGRAADTFRNLGEDIKLEIPQTGVTIGEVQRALVHWLGHQKHITGDISQTPGGLVLQTRDETGAGATFTAGADEDGALVERAAESIFRDAQPYRYGVYAWQQGRDKEAEDVFRKLALSGDPKERAWAFFGWGGVLGAAGDLRAQAAKARAGLQVDRRLAAGWQTLAIAEGIMGHDAQARSALANQLKALDDARRNGLEPRAAAQSRVIADAKLKEARADFLGAAGTWRRGTQLADYQASGSEAAIASATDLAWAHDLTEARFQPGPAEDGGSPLLDARRLIAQAWGRDGWSGLASQLRMLHSRLTTSTHARRFEQEWATSVQPWLAVAAAREGDLAGALQAIAGTPLDCAECLLGRGLVAETRGDLPGAETWLRRLVREAPDYPMGWLRLGEVLARQGRVADAEAAYDAAVRVAPLWADPQQALGESLASRGQTEAARKAFETAHRLAPAWDRPVRFAAAASQK